VPQRLTRIREQRFQNRQSSLVPIAVLDRFHRSEFQESLTPRFGT
jgi:hypothetical protein